MTSMGSMEDSACAVKSRTNISSYAGFVYYFVDVVSGNTRLGCGSSDVENLSSQLAALTHSILSLCIEYVDFVTVDDGSTILRVAVFPPHGVRNRLGERSMFRQGINWSKCTGERKVGERVVIPSS